jgi:hypothetical protein
MSDAIVGNFDVDIESILAELRKPNEIQAAFESNLSTHEAENKRLVTNAEDTLFTTFTKAVADKVIITPQYINDFTHEIEAVLWELTKILFANRDDYEINEADKTVTLTTETRPTLFYYWSGTGSRPYTGHKKYGISKDFKPSSGRITLTSVIGRGVTKEIACANTGTITVDAEIEPCEIGLYAISISTKQKWLASYDVFVGVTASGEPLTDEECKAIMELPVIAYTEDGVQTANWLRNVTGQSGHQLDYAVPTETFIERYASENQTAEAEEIERIKLRALRKKAKLEHALDDLRGRIKPIKQGVSANSGDRLIELKAGKSLKELEKQLRDKEQALFFFYF